MNEVFLLLTVMVGLCGVALTVFAITVLLLVYLILQKAVQPYFNSPALAFSTGALVTARRVDKVEKPEKSLKPGRSCGHCGLRLKNDPIKEVVLEETSYLVFVCSECKKQTLLVKQAVD